MLSIVPFQPIPNHHFSCVVPIDGGNTTLGFFLRYNDVATYWTVDISKDGKTLIASLPIKPAQNILEQFSYMEIGSAYIIPKSQAAAQWPGAVDLSSDWYIVWSDTQ